MPKFLMSYAYVTAFAFHAAFFGLMAYAKATCTEWCIIDWQLVTAIVIGGLVGLTIVAMATDALLARHYKGDSR